MAAQTVWGQTFDIYGPYETRLNDSVYTGYHKFGAEARVLPGFDVAPAPAASAGINPPAPRNNP